jgi:histidine triad (HIT) family protein
MTTDCLFCKIIAGNIPASTVYRDEQVTAIRDINPQAPTHILVLPNQHVAGISAAAPGDQAMLGGLLLAAQKIAAQEGLTGYRLVVNNGAEAGQSVFHLHLHLLGGRAMRWPPG